MFPCPGIQSMEPYASACDNTELSNGKKPLSEREMVSVLCFSPVACEEGEIIDCSFYHKECVCMCILVISVTHNQCISLKEKAKEWCLRTPPGPHMPPTDWSFTRLWHAFRLQSGRSAPGFHRTHQSPSWQLFAVVGAAQGRKGETSCGWSLLAPNVDCCVLAARGECILYSL